MKTIKSEPNPVEYLENVLNNWKSFCKSHSRFAMSILTLLEENKHLKREIKAYQRKENKRK